MTGAFSSGIAGPPPPLPSRKVMTFSRVALISGGMPGEFRIARAWSSNACCGPPATSAGPAAAPMIAGANDARNSIGTLSGAGGAAGSAIACAGNASPATAAIATAVNAFRIPRVRSTVSPSLVIPRGRLGELRV